LQGTQRTALTPNQILPLEFGHAYFLLAIAHHIRGLIQKATTACYSRLCANPITMKLQSIIAFFLICLSSIGGLFAQKVPVELQKKIEGTRNLAAIMKEVDAYYENGKKTSLNEEFESPYIHWKRFEQFYANRLDAKGNIPENVTQLMWDGWNNYKKDHPEIGGPVQNSSYGSWSAFGPTGITRYGRGYNSGFGRVNCIAFHPSDANILYLGLPQGGIWRTTNGGTSWSVLTDDLPSVGISGLVVSWANANIIYALTGDGDVSHGGFVSAYGFDQKSVGVLKSIDAGATWTQTGALPNAGTSFYGYKLIQHPSSSNTLFAATTAGIYRTTNGGTSWTQVETDTRFTDIEFKPGTPNTMYAVRRMQSAGGTNSNPFYRSTDGGVTWSSAGITGLTTTAERLAIGVSAANPSYVYLLTGPATSAGNFKGLYRSTNSGIDFTNRATTPNILGYPTAGTDAQDQTFYDLAIEVDPDNVNTVITAGINIWRSTDGGTTLNAATQWQDPSFAADAPAGDYVHADVHNLTYNPLNNYLYTCTDGGVGRSIDNGASWTFLSSNLAILATYHADWYEPDLDIIATGTQDNGTNIRYTASNTYRHINGADGFDCLIDQDDASDIMFVGNGTIYRTTDGGTTKTDRSPAGVGTFPQLARSYSDDLDIFAGDGNSVYRSTNRGTSWTTETTPAGSRVLSTCQSNSNRVYAGNGTSLWRSDDKGDNWELISGRPGYPMWVNVSDVESRPSNSTIIWACFGGYTAGAKVYSSNDSGDTWTNRSGTLPNLACHSIAVDANNTVYVGTDIGVFVRPATETDWQPYLNFLPRAPVAELMINNTASNIIAATFGRGNFRSTLYTACPATGTLVLGSTITGQRFYEYPIITSTTIVTGGVQTNVAFKGIDYVTLNPDFTAESGTVFKAYIGPCGNGGVQILNSLEDETPMEQQFVPARSGARFPLGNFNGVDNANRTVRFTITEPGEYSLRISDAAGKAVEIIAANQKFAAGVQQVNLSSSTKPGFYYLQLFKDNALVHFHEYIPK
jgi:photosystem II stability/assembly factor-like uncharacterized protein